MKANKNSDAGFVVTGIIIILIVIASLGLASWQSNKLGSKAHSGASQNMLANKSVGSAIQPKTATAQKTAGLVVAEWGVELTPADGLSDLLVKPTGQTDEVMFMTGDMQKLAPTCNGTAQGSRPLGALVRSSTELPQPSNNKLIRQIKDKFYYYYAPAAACSPDNDVAKLQYKNLDRVRASLDSLRVVE